jgi:hypothetical protein
VRARITTCFSILQAVVLSALALRAVGRILSVELTRLALGVLLWLL